MVILLLFIRCVLLLTLVWFSVRFFVLRCSGDSVVVCSLFIVAHFKCFFV